MTDQFENIQKFMRPVRPSTEDECKLFLKCHHYLVNKKS